MTPDTTSANPTSSLSCPNCGGALEATPTDQPQVVTCPYCAKPFILPAADGSILAVARPAGEALAPDDQPFVTTDDLAPEQRRQQDEELDAFRVRKVTKLRRSAYRGRSFLLIGALVCIAGALQLAVNAFYIFRRTAGRIEAEPRDFSTWSAGYLMVAMILLALAYRFFTRAADLKREADRSALAEPPTPPDLSALSDGRDRHKRLEEIDDDDSRLT